MLTGILLLYFGSNCIGQEAQVTLEQKNLKGKVKDVSYWYIDMDEERNHPDSTYYIERYNNDGQLTEELSIVGGRTDRKMTYVYNDKNQLTEEWVDDGKTKYKSRVFYYDRLGRLIEIKNNTSNNTLLFTINYRYDSKGRMLECKITDAQSKRCNNVMYRNNSDGLRVFSTSYSTEDTLVTQYKYDKHDELVEKVYRRRTERREGKILYQYNKEGLLTEKTEYWDGKLTQTQVHQYEDRDRRGNYLRESVFNDGKLTSRTQRTITYY